MNTFCQNCQFLYNHKIIPHELSCKHSYCCKCLYDKFYILKDLKVEQQNAKCFKCQKQSKARYNELMHEESLKANAKFKADKVVQLCLIGSTNVGKSSLMERLTKNKFFQQLPNTIGFNINTSTRRTIGEYEVAYHMYDTAGTQKFHAVSSMHYKKANILMIVYDISSNIEPNNLQYWVEQAAQHCQTKSIIIVGNKIDMMQEKGENQLENEPIKLAKQLALKNNSKHLTVSCKNGIRFAQLWNYLDQMALTKSEALIKKGKSSIIMASEKDENIKSTKKKTCC